MVTCARCGKKLGDCSCDETVHAPGEVFAPGATIPPPAADAPKADKKHGNFFLALMIAMAADALQIAVFPFFWHGVGSPLEIALDVLVGLAMIRLLGWHWVFLPSFVGEMLPLVDELPCWTLAVLFVRREHKKAESA